MRNLFKRVFLLVLVVVPIASISFAANAALKTKIQSPEYNGDGAPGSGLVK